MTKRVHLDTGMTSYRRVRIGGRRLDATAPAGRCFSAPLSARFTGPCLHVTHLCRNFPFSTFIYFMFALYSLCKWIQSEHRAKKERTNEGATPSLHKHKLNRRPRKKTVSTCRIDSFIYLCNHELRLGPESIADVF